MLFYGYLIMAFYINVGLSGSSHLKINHKKFQSFLTVIHKSRSLFSRPVDLVCTVQTIAVYKTNFFKTTNTNTESLYVTDLRFSCLLLNFLQTYSVTDPPVQALDLLCNPFMHRRKSLRAH